MTVATFSIDDEELHAFQRLIREVTGIALADSKRELIVSRLGRRLRHHGLATFGAYHKLLIDGDPSGDELRRMVNCITTNKTDFFREPHHFELLRQTILPGFGARHNAPIRIWSAACSTGEEPWSIAIAAREALGAEAESLVEIIGSDIDTDVLATAEAGIYSGESLDHLPDGIRRAHFLRGRGDSSHLVAVRPELRRMVSFRRLNLAEPAWSHEGRFDVIFCRNVMIYFDQELQRELVARFAGQLNPDGWLLVGHTENLQWLSGAFELAGTTAYRLRATPRLACESATAARAAAKVARVATVAENGPAADPGAGRVARRMSIVAGDVHVSREPSEVRTILGSCIAVCLFDPVARVGGMNHFMLPTGKVTTMPSRYGVHAMEMLINGIMKLGGDRRRLRAKVFGGAEVLAVLRSGESVSSENIAFIRRFLHDDGIPLVAERMGGTQPLEVRFETHTGRAFVHVLRGQGTTDTAERERRYALSLRERDRRSRDDVILFKEP